MNEFIAYLIASYFLAGMIVSALVIYDKTNCDSVPNYLKNWKLALGVIIAWPFLPIFYKENNK